MHFASYTKREYFFFSNLQDAAYLLYSSYDKKLEGRQALCMYRALQVLGDKTQE
jgi:hypothetical protein